MEHKIKFSEVKKVYTSSADEVQRGFYAYLRRLQKDASAAEADKQTQILALSVKEAEEAAKKAAQTAKDKQRAAKKNEAQKPEAEAAKAEAEAAKKAAEEARKRLQKQQKAAEEAKAAAAADKMRAESIAALAEVMQRKGLRAEDLTKDFIRAYLPHIFNASGSICTIKQIQPEDAEEVRKQYESNPEALREEDEKLYLLIPRNLFTANSLLSLFTKAADAKKKAEADAADKRSAAEKEAAAAEKEAKRAKKYEELRKKLQQYDAEQAAKAAQTVTK